MNESSTPETPIGKAMGLAESNYMQCSQPRLTSLVLLALASALPGGFTTQAQAKDNRAPEVPAVIQVPDGNKVHFHTYAEGVQIYSWNGSSWVFVAPEAVLFDKDGNVVGLHYAGPAWESDSGSKVVGARIASTASSNANSIPLLLLQAQTTEGPGIFERTTYIQRVNTVGGLAPSTPGTVVGQEARVFYTAEYFFYRDKANHELSGH